MAFDLIGQMPLLSFDAENDRNASIARRHYENGKKLLLKMGDWSFATERQKLAENASAPDFGYGKSFALPSGFLGTQEICDNSGNPIVKYKVEGQNILTDITTVNLVFTKNVDEGVFSPEFVDLLSAYLAWKMAYPVTLNDTTTQRAFENYKFLEDQMPTLDDKGDYSVYMESEDFIDEAYSGS